MAGIWHAHVFYEHVMQWYVFKLDIRREAPEGEALTGTIVAEFWNGDHERSAPPLCGSSGREAVRENATGRATGLAITFDATDWSEDPTCGFSGGYLLDHFSGTIDPALQEFQSVLNADAPEWRNVPTVFRRVECHRGDQAPEEAPRVVLKPPPFLPPEAPAGACGFR